METALVQVRPPKPKDAEALADVYAEAWRGAYRGIIPHLSLERMVARRGLKWWKSALTERRPLLVLDFDGAPSGYVTFGRSRSGRSPFQGEIFGVGGEQDSALFSVRKRGHSAVNVRRCEPLFQAR